MEASTKKGQLRSQLLASENDINTLSGFASSGRSQGPNMPAMPAHFPVNQQYYQQQPQQALSNHDLITPVNQRAQFDNASRKGSMASSMSMGRFFKKKEAFFDDDAGYDIGDVAGGAVSFNDIQHLRDNNSRYSISSRTADSTPIIPVLSAGGQHNSQNNIQYRKYMNHKKKMEMAQGARANSLAGTNSMNSMTQDNRAMSFGMMSDPRAMSMSAAQGAMGRPGMPVYPNGQGPRAMSMRPGPRPPPGRQMPPNMRTNSLNSNVMLNQGAPNGLSPQAIRSQSLTQGGGPFPRPRGPGPNGYQQPGPYGPMQQGMGPPYGMQQPPMGRPMGRPVGPNARNNGMSPHAAHSNESFMNVLKEEDEKEEQPVGTPHSLDPGHTDVDLNKSPEEDEEEDIVYKFEKDASSPQVSRKSTIKKSNSMRVRKLDLFKKDTEESPETVFEDRDPHSLDMNTARDRDSKRSNIDLDDNEVSDFNRRSAQKFEVLGSSVSEPDVFTTASEFSPIKNTGKAGDDEPESPTSNAEKEPANETVTSEALTPNTQKRKVVKMKSLVANTAFNNFRSPSSNSQATFSSESNSKESSDFDHHDKNYPNSSKISIYSHDYSKADKGYSPEDSAKSAHLNDETTFDQGSLNDERPLVPPKPTDSSPARVGSDVIYENQSGSGSFNAASSDYVSSNDTRSEDILARSASPAFLSGSGSDMHVEKHSHSSLADDRRAPPSAEPDGKERKQSRNSSISSKSKSFIRRLSRTGSKSGNKEAESIMKHRSGNSISSFKDIPTVKKPLHFTKEELAIMTCNNDLQNELQLVASELASSIKRELALEKSLRWKGGDNEPENQLSNRDLENESREKSRQIALLQEKLNSERRLRFISEEHAILAEHGQTPSALKLDYEKNELYKQLLAKNDLVNQLQDKLAEVQNDNNDKGDDNLLENYNELLRKNHELQTQLNNQNRGDHSWLSSDDLTNRRESLRDKDSDKAEIMSLRTQRDELREMITKLTSSQNVEVKIANDKIKTLEFKLEKLSLINDKLSRREKSDSTQQENTGPKFSSGQGGKLQGLSIVTPKHNLFDE